MEEPFHAPDKCQFNSALCGTISSYPNIRGCVVLNKLTAGVGRFFNADIPISEFDLILLRSDVPLKLDGLICPKHRFSLGKHWKPSAQCKYLEHPKNSHCKAQTISWSLYQFVKSVDSTFILGSLMCKQCQKKANSMRLNSEESDVCSEPDYVPLGPCVDDNEKFNRREQLDSLTKIFGIERVRFQASSNINSLSVKTMNYFRNVYQQMKQELPNTFCRLVAPGQELELKLLLQNQEQTKTDANAVILHLKEAFDSCSTREGRRAVLMLIPKTYSKADVCKMFDCSLYEIKQARKILKVYGTCGVEPKKEQVYSRLSIEKAQHFINFLFASGILHEVAYGTTKLKFDSNEKITIPNTILNGVHEHAVKEYIVHCTEIGYRPLGRTSLLNILNNMKVHTRQKLAGMDTFVVEGIEAFESLKLSATLLDSSDTKKYLTTINEAESYIKTRFKFHCEYDNSCMSHCIKHALSHPKDKDLISKCEKKHDRICRECLAVINCLASLKLELSHLPPSHAKDIAEYDVRNAESKILEWQRHLLRGVQQSKARTTAFQELGPTKALWMRDMGQKFNPTKTLEGMNEYFGKRGISNSIEVFLTKSFNTYHKQVYLAFLDRCDQDSLDTLCIADLVLEQFHRNNPHITEVALKSDNAGNYHANGVPEGMYQLGQKRGIRISAYNYNEAQLGKDQCDREAAIFKRLAELFLLQKETNKISTAKELLHAVLYNGGPKNTQVCVLNIDKTAAELEGVRKVTNISYYHSIDFQTDGALYREYYDVGNGKFHPYNNVKLTNGASYVVPWTSSVRRAECMTFHSRKQNERLICPEMLCVSEFGNENDMIAHIVTGSHNYPKIKTGMDKVLLYYAQQKNLQNVTLEATVDCQLKDFAADDTSIALFNQTYSQGWARKVRRVVRLTARQKDFIEDLFLKGSTTKSKLSAEQMAQRMKDEMVEGDYYFRPEEYLQTSQIRNLITRFKKLHYNPQTKLQVMSEDAGIEENIDEICDAIFCFDSDDEDFAGFDACDI